MENLIKSSSGSLGTTNTERFETDIKHVMTEVKKHKKTILLKKKEFVAPPAGLTAYEERMLQLQMDNLQLQKSSAAKAAEEKSRKGVVLADTKSNQFYGETSVMGDLLLEEDWEKTDNTTVSQAMRLISSWQTQMNVIERKYREFENDALEYSFPVNKSEPIDIEYARIRDKFERTRDAVLQQDRDRGLFTMEPAKTEKVKFPVFSGQPSEDYMKWKKKMETAFLKNRVPKDERADKLREYL